MFPLETLIYITWPFELASTLVLVWHCRLLQDTSSLFSFLKWRFLFFHQILSWPLLPMRSVPEHQRVDSDALLWAPLACMLYHNLESPNTHFHKVELISHSPQYPVNSLRVQKIFIDWKKNVWMNQQLSIYFQGSCKNPI